MWLRKVSSIWRVKFVEEGHGGGRGEQVKAQAYFTRRVLRVGFSTGLTVPAPLGRALGIRPGDEVRMYMVGEVLCVQRLGSEGFVPKVVAVRSAAPPLRNGDEEESGFPLVRE